MPALFHTQTFRFYAHAGTTTRIRPEDIGLGSYYFGIRYQEPVALPGHATRYWYIKTTTEHLDSKQDESLAQAIEVDVSYATETTFVNAPFGVGTVNWELIVSNTEFSTWTDNPGAAEIIKLPNITIDGVTYVNEGSFEISNWVNASNNIMSFATDPVGVYQSSTINTSLPDDDATGWLYNEPVWVNCSVWRSGSQVNSGIYMDGDVLRIIPDTNTGEDRFDQVEVYINGFSTYIDVYQTGPNPSGSYFFNDWDPTDLVFNGGSYAILVTGGTTQHIYWKITSGLGASFVPVWIRIWDTTDSDGTVWYEVSTKDDYWKNTWISCISSFIANGHTYSIDVRVTDPNA